MYLYIINGFEEGNWISLEREKTQIGRTVDNAKGGENNDVAIAHDRKVSREHVAFTKRGETTWLEDLGSTHGTMLNNGKLSAPQEVKWGDVVCIGETLLMVCETENRLPVMNLAAALK